MFHRLFYKNMSDAVLLTYGDNIIRQSDVELLNGPYWLNDNVISFYFEYLGLHEYKRHPEILFISPEVTHCLKAAQESEVEIFLDPLKAKDKELVFLALNDNRAFGQSGGTHWSLLVYCKKVCVFYNVDSMAGTNQVQAAHLAGKLATYFADDLKCNFQDLKCLQQDNSYDCGIYVICHTKFLADHWLETGEITDSGMILRRDVCGKRQELLDLISSLRNA